MIEASKREQDLNRELITKSLSLLLSPIVRILIKWRITFPLVCEVLRDTYVSQARILAAENNPRDKHSTSAIAFATGVRPNQIRKVEERENDCHSTQLHLNPETEIMEYWWEDPGFTDDKGQPLNLPIYGKGKSFQSLVKKSKAGSVGYGTILDTLLASNTVALSSDGKRVKPLERFYLTSANSEARLFETAAQALCRFGMTIEHNTDPNRSDKDGKFFQREIWTRMVPGNRIQEFREDVRNLLVEEHGRVANSISRWEASNPSERDHAMVGVGFHYFEVKNYIEGCGSG